MIVHSPAIILPRVAPLFTETETVNNLVTHTSIEFPVSHLQEKQIAIVATEVVLAGVPGALWCWVELSPWPSANIPMWMLPLPATAVYWAAIGGGGGALPPVAPMIEAATGVPMATHGIILPWQIHSAWARLVVQTPVAAGLPLAFWTIQCVIQGKG